MRILFVAIFLFIYSPLSFAKTVKYELRVTKGSVNLSGKKTVDWALKVNDSIPAPTLEFTEGDDAEITLINNTDEETSSHWHGILLPNQEDGVPYVNTPPIHPGESYTFRFKVRQHGTYWYHSHTMLQEQAGLYGAIVIHPKQKKISYDKDLVVVIGDWSDEKADSILANLRKDGDYYLYKKNSVRSYFGALKAGALGNTLKNEWQRMGGMDLSDVGYDAFLLNGKKDAQLLTAHPGERIRIRVINAGSSSYFYVSLGSNPFQVISADGIDVKPTWTKELLMGMAETYDILFTVPEHKNYELRATAQDVTGFASGWIGMGEKVYAPTKAKPDLYAAMDHSGHGGHAGHGAHSGHTGHEGHSGHEGNGASASGGDHAGMDHSSMAGMDHSSMEGMDHSQMDHSQMDHTQHDSKKSTAKKSTAKKSKNSPKDEPKGPVLEQLNVDGLVALSSTTLPSQAPKHDLTLVLGGDMERYVWHINGKAIYQDRILNIKEGEVVRITYQNETMMHHPMHLHGHFFRVLNAAGDLSPLKHTVDVPPHGSRVIEFYANEPGQWMLHCHNLYHMMTGMGRVVRYDTFKMDEKMQHMDHQDHHMHNPIFFMGSIEAASNHARAFFKLSKTWDTLELNGETRTHDKKWEWEGDLFYRRWINNYLNLVGGLTSFDDKVRGAAGFAYTLPMLVEAQALIDHKGNFRFNFGKRFQWTSTIFSEPELTIRQHEKPEWMVNLMYGPAWSWAVGANITEDKAGVGAQVKF